MDKNKKYKIGYTSGVYDLFHIGHLNVLERAKEMCDVLIVGVTTDKLCFERKQKYPVFNQDERCRIVGALRCVDKVVLQEDMDKVSMVKKIGADAVFVGSDWQGTPTWIEYEKEFAALGCDTIYLKHTDGVSSTIIKDRLIDQLENGRGAAK